MIGEAIELGYQARSTTVDGVAIKRLADWLNRGVPVAAENQVGCFDQQREDY